MYCINRPPPWSGSSPLALVTGGHKGSHVVTSHQPAPARRPLHLILVSQIFNATSTLSPYCDFWNKHWEQVIDNSMQQMKKSPNTFLCTNICLSSLLQNEVFALESDVARRQPGPLSCCSCGKMSLWARESWRDVMTMPLTEHRAALQKIGLSR